MIGIPIHRAVKTSCRIRGDGVWNGRRVLDPGWADAATTTDKTLGDEGYGYGWWVFAFPFAGREVKAFYAGGNGGQYVIVVPELDLNIVIFGGNYNQRVMHVPKYEYVRDYVLRAIEIGEKADVPVEGDSARISLDRS